MTYCTNCNSKLSQIDINGLCSKCYVKEFPDANVNNRSRGLFKDSISIDRSRSESAKRRKRNSSGDDVISCDGSVSDSFVVDVFVWC